jgi:hypothetical protein
MRSLCQFRSEAGRELSERVTTDTYYNLSGQVTRSRSVVLCHIWFLGFEFRSGFQPPIAGAGCSRYGGSQPEILNFEKSQAYLIAAVFGAAGSSSSVNRAT